MKSITFVARAIAALAIYSLVWPLARGTGLEDDAPQIAATQVAETVAEVPIAQTAPTVVSGLGAPLGNSRLDAYRGGFELVQNDMQLSGTVAGNTAINVPTGSNFIGQGAFANANGLPMVIQNSGSNVLIQNATIFNVQFK